MKVKNKKVRFGLLAKLLLGLVLPMILIMIFVGNRIIGQAKTIVTELDTNYLTAEAERAGEQVNAYFQRYIGIAEMAAKEETVVEGVSRWMRRLITCVSETADEEIKEIVASDEIVVYAWLCDLETKDFLQSDDTYETKETFDVTSRKWYQPVVDSKQSAVTGSL